MTILYILLYIPIYYQKKAHDCINPFSLAPENWPPPFQPLWQGHGSVDRVWTLQRGPRAPFSVSVLCMSWRHIPLPLAPCFPSISVLCLHPPQTQICDANAWLASLPWLEHVSMHVHNQVHKEVIRPSFCVSVLGLTVTNHHKMAG